MSDEPCPDTLLIDFGGVLTSAVFDAFGEGCVRLGLARTRFADVLDEGPEASRLLVEMETGRLPLERFEHELAALLGPEVPAAGLSATLTAALRPDVAMRDAACRLRAHGVTTVLLSNSMGLAPYAGLDREGLFDHVVLSELVGVRKPSRAIYRQALERAGATAERTVFVDDLAINCSAAERLGIRAIHHRDAAETIPALERVFGVSLCDADA